jgi:hypothetical protein
MTDSKLNISNLLYRYRFAHIEETATESLVTVAFNALHKEFTQLRQSGTVSNDYQARFDFWAAKLVEVDTVPYEESSEEQRVKLAIKSFILQELARIYDYYDDMEAENVFEEAVTCAFESSNEFAIHFALNSLGGFYSMRDRGKEAIVCYQVTVLFTRGMWSGVFLSSLQNIAYHWGRQEETMLLSLAMYEWLSVMAPDNISIRLTRYKHLLKMGRRADVIAEGDNPDWNDIASISRYIAANWALRRKKRANAAIDRVLSDNSGLFDGRFKYLLKLTFRKEAEILPVDPFYEAVLTASNQVSKRRKAI